MVVLAGANLNWARGIEAQEKDREELRSKADALLTQEDKTGRKSQERLTTSLIVARRGSTLAALDRRGYKIRFRRWVWAVVDIPGVGPVALINGHQAPRRMPGLRPVYAWRLRRLCRRFDRWIAYADWNEFLRNDPCDLGRIFKAKWYGEGIDGYAVHPDLLPHVKGFKVVPRPGRKDGHPFIYLTVGD